MKLLEVRCCCIPKKLLGYLPVPEYVRSGDELSFQYLMPPFGSVETEALAINDNAQIRNVGLTAALYYEKPALDHVGIRLRFDSHLCLKSNNYPVEELRLVPGWVEAK